ncbi:MAG: DUF1636 domain-containing protein [Gluconacetobacter diazotrophicus]|nr:DUF1636 domain-containing protein [Gluconacetobacter diazotrophicus]
MPDPVAPPALPVPVLHVCVTCRGDERDGEIRPGRRLFERLCGVADRSITVRPVECLARCPDGCTAALTMPGKWSLLLGRLTETVAEDLLLFAGSYAASRTGMVMPSRRPASLANVVLGRVPGSEAGEAA